jgi:hypothetical protein
MRSISRSWSISRGGPSGGYSGAIDCSFFAETDRGPMLEGHPLQKARDRCRCLKLFAMLRNMEPLLFCWPFHLAMTSDLSGSIDLLKPSVSQE